VQKKNVSIDDCSVIPQQNCNMQAISYKINEKDNKANVSVYLASTVKHAWTCHAWTNSNVFVEHFPQSIRDINQ